MEANRPADDDPPGDLVLAVAEVRDDLTREIVEASNLPTNWREAAAPPKLTRVGDEFAQRAVRCLLLVPSVLAPNENNCLINPAHPHYKKIVVGEVEPLSYDPRMLQKKRSHGGQ